MREVRRLVRRCASTESTKGARACPAWHTIRTASARARAFEIYLTAINNPLTAYGRRACALHYIAGARWRVAIKALSTAPHARFNEVRAGVRTVSARSELILATFAQHGRDPTVNR